MKFLILNGEKVSIRKIEPFECSEIRSYCKVEGIPFKETDVTITITPEKREYEEYIQRICTKF